MADKDVKIGIEVVKKGEGAKEAKKDIDELNKSADNNTKKFQKQGNKVDQLKSKFRGLSRTLSKSNPKLFKMGKYLGRGGLLYAGIMFLGKGVSWLTDKIGGLGDKVKGFGDDLALTGSKSADAVQGVGSWLQKAKEIGPAINRTLNPLGAYIDAVKKNAEAQRELNRINAKAKMLQAQATKAVNQARKEYEELDSTLIKYESSLVRAGQKEKRLADFLKLGNHEISERAKLLAVQSERRKIDINDKADTALDSINPNDPNAEKIRRKIEKAREIALEKVRRFDFREKQKRLGKEFNLVEESRKAEANKTNRLKGLTTDKLGTKLLSDERFENLQKKEKRFKDARDQKGGATLLEGEDENDLVGITAELKKQEAIRKKIKESGRSGGADDLFSDIKKSKEKVIELRDELHALKVRARDNVNTEETRKLDRGAGIRNLNRDNANTDRAEARAIASKQLTKKQGNAKTALDNILSDGVVTKGEEAKFLEVLKILKTSNDSKNTSFINAIIKVTENNKALEKKVKALRISQK